MKWCVGFDKRGSASVQGDEGSSFSEGDIVRIAGDYGDVVGKIESLMVGYGAPSAHVRLFGKRLDYGGDVRVDLSRLSHVETKLEAAK